MADERAAGQQPEQQQQRGAGGDEVTRLRRENAALTQKLAEQTQAIVAERGPEQGTAICYQRQGEGFCRPGVIASEGFTELVKAPGGMPSRHALIEYGEAPWTVAAEAPAHMKEHSFQVDRPWDPMGKAETWHIPKDCPRQGGPGCPYSKTPEWPAKRRPHEPQAP